MSAKENKEVYLSILKNLQEDANKKLKTEILSTLREFLSSTELDEDTIRLLYEGENNIKGILELCGCKNRLQDLKSSSIRLLEILHYLILNSFNKSFKKVFIELDPSILVKMNLSHHFFIGFKRNNKKQYIVPLELAKVLNDERPYLEMKEYIDPNFVDKIKENFKNINKKRDYFRNSLSSFKQFILNIAREMLTIEPENWEEVTKIKNKLLILDQRFSKKGIEFLEDEEKALQNEKIQNFVDPLDKNERIINYNAFDEKERVKVHVQSDQFDHIYFLEKFYGKSNIADMQENFQSLVKNMTQLNTNDKLLLDINLYKYLDCKHNLTIIIDNYNNKLMGNLSDFREKLIHESKILNASLLPIKNSFKLILESKVAKDVLEKFQRLFFLKEEFDQFIKDSDFEGLADYFRRVKNELDLMTDDSFIFNEFCSHFYQLIDATILIIKDFIKKSLFYNVIIKNFKCLMNYDIDSDTIDDLFLHFQHNFNKKIEKVLIDEYRNEPSGIKDFFCDEHFVHIRSDDFFFKTMKNSQKENVMKNIRFFGKKKNDSHGESLKIKEFIDTTVLFSIILKETIEFTKMALEIEKIVNEHRFHKAKLYGTMSLNRIGENIFNELLENITNFFFGASDKFAPLKDMYSSLTNIQNSKDEDLINDNENLLFVLYENNDDFDTVLNEKLDVNIIDQVYPYLFDIFKYIESLVDPNSLKEINKKKSLLYEKLYFSVINKRFWENIIKIFDFEQGVFLYCFFGFNDKICFKFTYDRCSDLYSTYIEMMKFYDKVGKLCPEIKFNHQLIRLSYVLSLKVFVLIYVRIYERERNEKNLYNNSINIIKILKNYDYLEKEIPRLTKSLFKSKIEDLETHLEDVYILIRDIRVYFIELYILNSVDIMKEILHCENTIEYQERYNNTIIEKNFNQMRSYVIDLLLCKADIICNLMTLFNFEKSRLIYNKIIDLFFIELLEFMKKKMNIKREKFLSQKVFLYDIEMRFLFQILSSSMNSENIRKKDEIIEILRKKTEQISSEAEKEELEKINQIKNEIVSNNKSKYLYLVNYVTLMKGRRPTGKFNEFSFKI